MPILVKGDVTASQESQNQGPWLLLGEGKEKMGTTVTEIALPSLSPLPTLPSLFPVFLLSLC